MTIENREDERKSFIAEVVLEFASGKRQVRVSDISAGGCYVESIISVQVGDEIKFELLDRNGDRLPFTGQIAYHFDGMGFGVKFTNLTNEQKKYLEGIIGT
jgi:PilZ domain